MAAHTRKNHGIQKIKCLFGKDDPNHKLFGTGCQSERYPDQQCVHRSHRRPESELGTPIRVIIGQQFDERDEQLMIEAENRPRLITKWDGTLIVARNQSAYTPEIVAQVTELIVNGMPPRRACQSVGVGGVTYDRWLKQYPEFQEAVDASLAHSQEVAVGSLMEGIIGRPVKKTTVKETNEGTETTTVEWTEVNDKNTQFFLERRFPEDWKARSEIDIDPKKLSDEELAERVAKINQKLNAIDVTPRPTDT